MSKILVLAESGFGKSTSLVGDKTLGIEGLNPQSTYVISVTSKPLPGKGSNKKFPVFTDFNINSKAVDLKDYRRIVTNSPNLIAHAIKLLGTVSAITEIVLDDTNYIMQDYYMEKALSSGWDAPKKIGYDMGMIFRAIDKLPANKNFIMLAHGEEYDKVDGRKGYRMKTTGKMVDCEIEPLSI